MQLVLWSKRSHNYKTDVPRTSVLSVTVDITVLITIRFRDDVDLGSIQGKCYNAYLGVQLPYDEAHTASCIRLT